MKQASDNMYEMALGTGTGKIRHVYSVQKIKETSTMTNFERF
jgi:hypothetical protein